MKPMLHVARLVALTLALGLTNTAANAADDWPQFRGPDGQGHAEATGLPHEWSETENVRWKTPIAGLGWSSPVVAGEQIWVTTAIEDRGSLRAVCLDRQSGQVVHDVEVFRQDDLGRINNKNSYASPTPVVDGQHVFVHFGAHGTACLTTEGRIVWRVRLAYDQHHGPAGSPVVWNDLVFISCDGNDVQYTVALDKLTGKLRWQPIIPAQHAYSTPLVIQAGAAEQLVTSGGGALIAYDPPTGQELWRCEHGGHSVIPRPVESGGLVYFCTGYWNPALFAVRSDGSGDVTDSHVVFKLRRGVPHTPSPLVVGSQLYVVSDQGVLTCVDAANGKEIWHQRLGGNFSASPTLADGKIFLVSEDATTYVLIPGDKFHQLAENHLDGRALASPAFVGRSIYLRSDTHLYCLEASRTVQASATTSRRETGRFLR